MWKVICKCK